MKEGGLPQQPFGVGPTEVDMPLRSGSPTEPSSPDSIEYSVAVRIARNRFGPGVDMGGAHNPRPSEWRLAREIVEDVRASSPQPDIDVEQLFEALSFLGEDDILADGSLWKIKEIALNAAAEYNRRSLPSEPPREHREDARP